MKLEITADWLRSFGDDPEPDFFTADPDGIEQARRRKAAESIGSAGPVPMPSVGKPPHKRATKVAAGK